MTDWPERDIYWAKVRAIALVEEFEAQERNKANKRLKKYVRERSNKPVPKAN